ncbi:MAG TPA: HEPN domain-containing protein [Solirubrobacteraceae bacterium]|nr:HEPN domain-containing protein [Solirubrobacteraceae bacterium]
MPTPEQLEVADLYLTKAASDLAAARALASDAGQQDDVVGFHAQQAVEKSMKAVLALRGSDIPRSHDLVLLARLASKENDRTPPELEEAQSLSPWAVAMRYDEMEARLDRDAAIRVAAASLSWADGLVAAARNATPHRA